MNPQDNHIADFRGSVYKGGFGFDVEVTKDENDFLVESGGLLKPKYETFEAFLDDLVKENPLWFTYYYVRIDHSYQDFVSAKLADAITGVYDWLNRGITNTEWNWRFDSDSLGKSLLDIVKEESGKFLNYKASGFDSELADKQYLVDYFGKYPTETGLKKKMRLHQGWWRMNVLGEKPGQHPKDKSDTICNTIWNGQESKKNFLTENTNKAVEVTVNNRQDSDSGIMEQDRLFNNLLSSQPLCFNFFGELMMDTNLGLKVLQTWFPELTKLNRVIFEYAPKERYTNDNSAFDVAFEVMSGNKTGLIGLECKYTDSFSTKEYDTPTYKNIYEKSSSFVAKYDDLKASYYNQLFRNQLIAEAIVQSKKYDFVKTGLFCYHLDNSAITTALEFQKMLVNPGGFQIITYSDFIAGIQRLDITWKQREWTMMLWARYCGTELSNRFIDLVDVK